jgi:hypothetical protein
MPGLDSQLDINSAPETTTKSAVLTPTVVPKLDPECFRHRQQWQYVIGPINPPRISYCNWPQAQEPFNIRVSWIETAYDDKTPHPWASPVPSSKPLRAR